MHIESVILGERASLLTICTQTGLFTPDDAEALLGHVLDELAGGGLGAGHAAVACRAAPSGPALGWAYFAPDAFADAVWNLWWIGVHPAHHGSGAGRALLDHVERTVAAAQGRVLVIETSDQPPLARARSFYTQAGYRECGRIPDFYAPGDAKVIFARTLSDPR